jgi:hypothetical protein
MRIPPQALPDALSAFSFAPVTIFAEHLQIVYLRFTAF